MFKNFKTLIIILVSINSFVNAQTSDSTSFEMTGSLDAYYRLNVNGDFDQAPATSFANLPGFALGMANINATYYKKRAGITLDLVVGPRGEDATFLSGVLRPSGSSQILNQLYAFVDVTDKVKVTLGNFNTFLGYEVISPTGNFNYSTSYMFSYGPFSHTGLKVDADLGQGWSLMAGLFNPTDATEYNPTNDYVGGAQLGYSFDSGSIYFNVLADSDFYQADVTAGVDLTSEFYLGLNATIAQDAFSGVATYLQYALSEDFKLGTRIEYFQDKGVGAVGLDESALDVTLTGNYKIGDLTIIPEIRLDKISTPTYTDDLDLNESLSSFVLAAVYGF